jgi:hypothetical protein
MMPYLHAVGQSAEQTPSKSSPRRR